MMRLPLAQPIFYLDCHKPLSFLVTITIDGDSWNHNHNFMIIPKPYFQHTSHKRQTRHSSMPCVHPMTHTREIIDPFQGKCAITLGRPSPSCPWKVMEGLPCGDDINLDVDDVVLPILRCCAKALAISCLSL
jgi:hypothetical protein